MTEPVEQATRYMCPWCGRVDIEEAASRRHLAREKGRLEREARERIGAGEDPAEVLSDLITERRLERRDRQRLPGEGSVSRYVMRDGTVRWMFKFSHNGAPVLRRVDPDGERWTTYEAAEQALYEVQAGDPRWVGPDGEILTYGDDLQARLRDHEAATAWLRDGLRAAREARGLSLAELEKRSGIDRRQLARVEKGNGSLSIDTLGRLADALGLHDLGEQLSPLR